MYVGICVDSRYILLSKNDDKILTQPYIPFVFILSGCDLPGMCACGHRWRYCVRRPPLSPYVKPDRHDADRGHQCGRIGIAMGTQAENKSITTTANLTLKVYVAFYIQKKISVVSNMLFFFQIIAIRRNFVFCLKML
jgi:hypothetical protein